MLFRVWIVAFGLLAVVALAAFGLQFSKDMKIWKASADENKNVLFFIPNWLLVFVSLGAISAAILLYMEWQEQLQNYLLNR